MRERWAPLYGFEGRYRISSYGRIQSLIDRFGRPHAVSKFIFIKRKPNGYMAARVSDGSGKIKDIYVHRAILFSFIGPPLLWQECAHLDGDRANNDLSNLRWVSRKENFSHKKIHGTSNHGENHYRALLNERLVRKIRKLYAMGLKPMAICSRLDISDAHRPAVQAVVIGKTWAHVK